jgi:uncharacterized RmlC-like cupin family protein
MLLRLVIMTTLTFLKSGEQLNLGGIFQSRPSMASDSLIMGERMKRSFLSAALVFLVVVTSALSRNQRDPKEIVAVAPAQVQWFTPTYYTDGRQRAQLYGDSSQGGPWIDRVKIPAGKHVAAHTHPQDELVTIIDGTWYVGVGERFDPARLKGYPAGSFLVIPAGLAHFVATKESSVIVQLSGTERFHTDLVEK